MTSSKHNTGRKCSEKYRWGVSETCGTVTEGQRSMSSESKGEALGQLGAHTAPGEPLEEVTASRPNRCKMGTRPGSGHADEPEGSCLPTASPVQKWLWSHRPRMRGTLSTSGSPPPVGPLKAQCQEQGLAHTNACPTTEGQRNDSEGGQGRKRGGDPPHEKEGSLPDWVKLACP